MAEDLPHRYARALADHMTSPDHKYDGGPAHGFVWDWECCAHAVLDVRDAELEQLREDALVVIAESVQEREALRDRAEKAEAANSRVSAVHRVHNCEQDGHVLERTPNPCLNDGVCSCGQPGDRCPTRIALGGEEEATDGL